MLPPLISEFDTPIELARRNFLHINADEVSALSRAHQEARRKYAMAFLNSLKGIPGITLIDPLDTMCDAENCRTVDSQGAPIMRDTNHLRTSYTEKNPLLDKYLR